MALKGCVSKLPQTLPLHSQKVSLKFRLGLEGKGDKLLSKSFYSGVMEIFSNETETVAAKHCGMSLNCSP